MPCHFLGSSMLRHQELVGMRSNSKDPNALRPKKPMADFGYSRKPLVVWTFFAGCIFAGGTLFLLQETCKSNLYTVVNSLLWLPGKASLERNIKAQENEQRRSQDVNGGRVQDTNFSESHARPETAVEKLPRIRGTPLKGKPVEFFRTYLDCISESGRWVYNSTPRHLPWNWAGDQYASQCDGRHSAVPGNAVGEYADILASSGQRGNWKVREELKWVWKSNNSCPLILLNRDDLCRLIGANGNVLVVGDSINHLLQWSLLNNLLKNRSDPQVVTSSSSCRTCEGFEVCSDVLGGPGKGFKVGFVRNDRISPTFAVNNDTWKNFLEWPWLHLLKDWNIKLLLINKGAHYEADEIYVKSLRQTFSVLQALHPDLLVIFRNTPPGHINCTSYNGPISERQELQANHGDHLKWHWHEFLRQNGIAKKIVEDAGYVYMDVDAMLSKRPDGHINEKDCLHYCLPGPLDSVVELFYNVLSLLRSHTTY